MSDLFGRRIEVIAGRKKFDGDDFTIYFEVPFDDGVEPNVASIEIYNLRDQTINDMKRGMQVTINAGYAKDVGAIFLGQALSIYTDGSGVDKITELECVDSGETWFKNKINKTYKSGINARQILNDLLKRTGLDVGALKLPRNKVYKSGKTFDKTLAEAIYEVALDCRAKMHVTKRKIYIRPKNEGNNIRFIIDKNRGLIGSPTRIEKDIVTGRDKDGKDIKKTVRGWSITTLLNHRVFTDSIIDVKSETANGRFRVDNGKHTANGSNFYTEMEVFPL